MFTAMADNLAAITHKLREGADAGAAADSMKGFSEMKKLIEEVSAKMDKIISHLESVPTSEPKTKVKTTTRRKKEKKDDSASSNESKSDETKNEEGKS